MREKGLLLNSTPPNLVLFFGSHFWISLFETQRSETLEMPPSLTFQAFEAPFVLTFEAFEAPFVLTLRSLQSPPPLCPHPSKPSKPSSSHSKPSKPSPLRPRLRSLQSPLRPHLRSLRSSFVLTLQSLRSLRPHPSKPSKPSSSPSKPSKPSDLHPPPKPVSPKGNGMQPQISCSCWSSHFCSSALSSTVFLFHVLLQLFAFPSSFPSRLFPFPLLLLPLLFIALLDHLFSGFLSFFFSLSSRPHPLLSPFAFLIIIDHCNWRASIFPSLVQQSSLKAFTTIVATLLTTRECLLTTYWWSEHHLFSFPLGYCSLSTDTNCAADHLFCFFFFLLLCKFSSTLFFFFCCCSLLLLLLLLLLLALHPSSSAFS